MAWTRIVDSYWYGHYYIDVYYETQDNPRENYTDVIVSKEIKPITPGLSLIAEKVFKCKSQRVIRNE